MDLSNFKTDPVKELEGIWVPIDAETELLIARFNNKNFTNMQARLLSPFQRAGKGKVGITDEKADEILNTCIAHTILLGWKNLKLDDEEVEYSQSKAFDLLSDPTLKDFRNIVVLESQEMDHYREQQIVEQVGNLQA